MKLSSGITHAILLGATALCGSLAHADLIDPTSFSATLAVGESVTISKTVIVEADPSFPAAGDAMVDLMFMFDVSGSMGGEIRDAQLVATQALDELAVQYDLMTGLGWYSDPQFDGVHADLNNTNTQVSSGLADLWDAGSCTVAGLNIGCGGDRLEVGFDAIADAANNASWREGSERFIFTLGDAGFKPAGENLASTAAALADNDVTLLGLTYASDFSESIQGLIDASGIEGRVATQGLRMAELIAEKAIGVYNRVTIDDLLGGLPGVEVSVVCTEADPGRDGEGRCTGDTARGTFDRTVDRSFIFDVTFTALETGVYEFDTFGLVNGKTVASERDRITVGNVPSPGTFLLLGLGIAGLITQRARQRQTS
ncbi:MAG: hypothetical protein Hals2KO_20990 [Halioglobus sp.]